MIADLLLCHARHRATCLVVATTCSCLDVFSHTPTSATARLSAQCAALLRRGSHRRVLIQWPRPCLLSAQRRIAHNVIGSQDANMTYATDGLQAQVRWLHSYIHTDTKPPDVWVMVFSALSDLQARGGFKTLLPRCQVVSDAARKDSFSICKSLICTSFSDILSASVFAFVVSAVTCDVALPRTDDDSS